MATDRALSQAMDRADLARRTADLERQRRRQGQRMDQLEREAPARALDWLLRVRDHEAVPPLRRLNPLIQQAVQIRVAQHKGTPPPRFHGEDALDWRTWLRLDGRTWDSVTRIAFDSPLDGQHDAETLPRLVAGEGSRRLLAPAEVTP